MSGSTGRVVATLLTGAAFSVCLLGLALAGGTGPAPAAADAATPAARPIRQSTPSTHVAGFNPLAQRREGDHLVSDLAGGGEAILTLDPGLQEHLTRVLRSHRVPFGAVVALEPSSGRVLAYVSHSSADPDAGDLVRDVSAPSASVFKLVTAAALLDAGIRPDVRVCYGGGMHRLSARDLIDNPRRDRACATLTDGIGYSINAVLAKLADANLDARALRGHAHSFGYGRELPFDVPVPVSPIDIPDDRLEFARTAAGFWHTHMSPLHGALLAAAIANGGVMPRATMIARTFDSRGDLKRSYEPRPGHPVMSRDDARKLAQMMTTTVSRGTAREAFRNRRGQPFLRDIVVAGKTGSLSSDRPYRAYSWWVGFAPEAAPTIAIAALVVNGETWHIKAAQVAREALRYRLIDAPAAQARATATQRRVNPALDEPPRR